ncbi:hypothetical protein [Oligoflexus tunisiensis]|uniref:hypothetical protein n=1 Tax=Oligoflexus tunisiensis TaxID=708132 RepID=UPI00114CF6CB|nr:hypothetical protein [Oligoflexus tunisiensis]
MKKRLLIVLGSGVATLLAATVFYVQRPEATDPAAVPTGGQRKAAIWKPQEVPTWTLVRGQELVYDLTYTGNGHIPGETDQAFEVRLLGTLHVVVLSEETDGYRVWLSIRPEGAPQLHDVPVPLRSNLLKAWIEGTGARMASRGFQIEPQLDSNMDPTVSQFWLSLCERMQVDLPAVLQTPIWELQEVMAGSSVSTRYELDPTHLSPGLLAEKIYIQKYFEATTQPQQSISGESLVILRPRFEGLDQLQADAREVQVLNGEDWTSDSVLTLQWLKQDTLAEARVASLEARWGQSRSEAGSGQDSSMQKVALGGLGLDEIWSQMFQPGTQNSQELYLKLKAWIFLHPAEIKRLMERLRNLDESDPALKMAIRALAAAGQTEAQNALVDLLNQRHTDAPLARKIVTTLGLVPEPTLEAQKSLELLSQSAEDSAVRRSSRLALGLMGQRLSQKTDPEAQKRAAELEALALRHLQAAQDLADITEALVVVGNCGVSRIEDLNPWLTHPDPAIRSQAFFALRFARPNHAPEFLVRQYPGEASAEVRRQILHALSLRTPDAGWFSAIKGLLNHPLPDDDKITLAKILVGTVRKHRESSLQILAQLLAQTQDAAARETLTKYQETAKRQVTF